MEKTLSFNKKDTFLQIVKGSMVALCISMVFILAFALVLRFFNINQSFIMPINQVIKIISILIGVFSALKKNKSNGLLKGFLIGLTYSVLAYVVFCLLSLSFSFSLTLMLDIICCSLLGAICGVFAVNIGK